MMDILVSPCTFFFADASMRTFWKPVDLMAMMQETVDHRLADLSSAVHIIWLEFIVDEKLVSLSGSTKFLFGGQLQLGPL